LYFETFLPKETHISIYTSSFHEKKICENHYTRPIIKRERILEEKQCQKSQRMWITANILYNHFKFFFSYLKMQSQFCIGEKKQLLQKIDEDSVFISDAIVVWEHDEIIDMIRYMGIEIGHWHHKHMYDIVFMVDIKEKRLYYDCVSYTFYDNETICKKNAKWLQKYGFISDYFANKDVLSTNYKSYKHYDYYYFKVVTSLLFIMILFITCIYVFCCTIRRQYIVPLSTRHHSYIEIK
jgi:hypothetical protein